MIALRIPRDKIRREEGLCPTNNPVDQFEYIRRWFVFKLREAGFDMDREITRRECFETFDTIFEQETE